MTSVNGYSKDDKGSEVVQMSVGDGVSVCIYLTPDEARHIAAALAAAAAAAGLPE